MKQTFESFEILLFFPIYVTPGPVIKTITGLSHAFPLFYWLDAARHQCNLQVKV